MSVRRILMMTMLLAAGVCAASAPRPGDSFSADLKARTGLFRFFTDIRGAELKLDGAPTAPVNGVPKDLSHIRHGLLKLGDGANSEIAVVLATNSSGRPVLLLDERGDRDFTGVKPVEFGGASGRAYRAEFTAPARYSDGGSIPTHLVMILPGDPATGPAIYATDTYRFGDIALPGNKKASVALVDLEADANYKNLAGIALLIDPAGGDFTDNPSATEPYDPREPFNIGGVTYEIAQIAPSGDKVTFKVSSKRVSARPVLAKGFPAPNFTATDLNGKKVSLSDYRGKVVLLDFWATWCGPCIREMPNVKKTYEKFRAKGFDILGVSLDRDKTRLQEYLKQNKIGWRQVFDGKMWETEAARKYNIRAIPAAFLLDRKGVIIERDLRGDRLYAAVERALK